MMRLSKNTVKVMAQHFILLGFLALQSVIATAKDSRPDLAKILLILDDYQPNLATDLRHVASKVADLTPDQKIAISLDSLSQNLEAKLIVKSPVVVNPKIQNLLATPPLDCDTVRSGHKLAGIVLQDIASLEGALQQAIESGNDETFAKLLDQLEEQLMALDKAVPSDFNLPDRRLIYQFSLNNYLPHSLEPKTYETVDYSDYVRYSIVDNNPQAFSWQEGLREASQSDDNLVLPLGYKIVVADNKSLIIEKDASPTLGCMDQVPFKLLTKLSILRVQTRVIHHLDIEDECYQEAVDQRHDATLAMISAVNLSHNHRDRTLNLCSEARILFHSGINGPMIGCHPPLPRLPLLPPDHRKVLGNPACQNLDHLIETPRQVSRTISPVGLEVEGSGGGDIKMGSAANGANLSSKPCPTRLRGPLR